MLHHVHMGSTNNMQWAIKKEDIELGGRDMGWEHLGITEGREGVGNGYDQDTCIHI